MIHSLRRSFNLLCGIGDAGWHQGESAKEKVRCAMQCCFQLSRHKSGGRDTRELLRWPRALALVILTCLSCHCLLAAEANGGGSLTGSVVDDNGRPVPGARVLISQTPSVKHSIKAPPVVTGPLAATVTSDSDGNFRASGLAPAQYILCAKAPNPGLLDPCHWSTSAPTVTVSAAQPTSGVKITMPKGAILQVHIDDPQRLLKPVATGADSDLAVHIVTAKGIHYSAPILSNNGVGREHKITVPFDTAVNLRVLSSRLNVNEQSGKLVALTGAAVNVPAGTTPSVVNFTVTGKK